MKELTSPRVLYIKASLLLFLGTLSALLLLLEAPNLRTAVYLLLTVWAFSRAYYFCFYVLERYVDPSLRFRGLLAMAAHLSRSSSVK